MSGAVKILSLNFSNELLGQLLEHISSVPEQCLPIPFTHVFEFECGEETHSPIVTREHHRAIRILTPRVDEAHGVPVAVDADKR